MVASRLIGSALLRTRSGAVSLESPVSSTGRDFTRKTEHYRADIDGLRAIAVLAVILCHAQLSLFAGGYIGVDVFFVISGYVVASSILRDQAAAAFSLGEFYARRVRRLAPALYCVVGTTLVFCLLFLFPEDIYDALKNGLFIAILSSNVFLARKIGYFDPSADQQPLLHTWSLSVEEQFYLVFPLLLVLLRRVRPVTLFAVVSAIFLVSLAYSAYAVSSFLPRSYFQIQTRGFEFLAGVLVASWPWRTGGNTNSLGYDAMLLVGLGIVGACSVVFGPRTPMPGIYALLPCVGAMLVIGIGHRARLLSSLLKSPFLVYCGKLSYALYLWHWPIFFAFRRFHLTTSGWTFGGIAFCFAIAIPTHHLVEQRIRYAKWSKRKTMVLLFLAPAVILGMLVLAAKWTDNFASLYPAKLRQSYEQTGRSVFEGARAQRCWNKVEVTSARDCSVGDLEASMHAVFWGDSHAYHLINFIDRLGKDYGLSIHDVTHTMCPPMSDGPSRAGDPAYQDQRENCLRHNRLVSEYVLSRPEIDVVIMAAVWPNYVNQGTGEDVRPTGHGFMPGDRYLEDTVAKLRAAGKRVVLVDDIPLVPPELENCASNRLYGMNLRDGDCSYPESYARELHRPTEELFAKVRKAFPDVSVIHTYDVPCAGGRCSSEILGVDLYRHNDIGHLGLGGSNIYYRAYQIKHPNELASIFCAAGSACSRSSLGH